MADPVIDVLRGVAQTRDDDNRMHEDDFSTPPADGAAFWRASDDLALLAELRAHAKTEDVLDWIDRNSMIWETREQYAAGREVVKLLLKLLRGQP